MKSLLIDRVFNRPLLVHGAKANAIAPFLARELLGARDVTPAPVADPGRMAEPRAGKLAPEYLNEYGDPIRPEDTLKRVGNGVGVIEVEGTLVNKGAWLGAYSGMTSYQGLISQFAAAIEDDTIRAVVVEIDSPGGEVAGIGDASLALAALSDVKPTIAILTDSAYSAGYWLASQCRQIILPPSGGCGSIGVVAMHVDMAKYLDNEGFRVTIITSGEHKADGNPYEALPDDVRAAWQAEFDIVRGQFADAVAGGRGKRLTREAALATEARTYMGQAAVDAGLADAVASPLLAFNEFVALF